MAYTMQDGLKLKRMGLNHTQISGQYMMKMKQQLTCNHVQMQGTKPKAQSATPPKHGKHEIWHTITYFPALK